MVDQKKINDFTRTYLDKSKVIHWNTIKLSGTTKEHAQRVFDVCWQLYEMGVPFCTEAVFKDGYRPDVLAPTHIKPIIEVRHSETDKRTEEKFQRIPEELHDKIIWVNTDEEFYAEMIL